MEEDLPVGGSSFRHHAGAPLAQPHPVAGAPSLKPDSPARRLHFEERALDGDRVRHRAELVSAEHRLARGVLDFHLRHPPRGAGRGGFDPSDLAHLDPVAVQAVPDLPIAEKCRPRRAGGSGAGLVGDGLQVGDGDPPDVAGVLRHPSAVGVKVGEGGTAAVGQDPAARGVDGAAGAVRHRRGPPVDLGGGRGADVVVACGIDLHLVAGEGPGYDRLCLEGLLGPPRRHFPRDDAVEVFLQFDDVVRRKPSVAGDGNPHRPPVRGPVDPQRAVLRGREDALRDGMGLSADGEPPAVGADSGFPGGGQRGERPVTGRVPDVDARRRPDADLRGIVHDEDPDHVAPVAAGGLHRGFSLVPAGRVVAGVPHERRHVAPAARGKLGEVQAEEPGGLPVARPLVFEHGGLENGVGLVDRPAVCLADPGAVVFDAIRASQETRSADLLVIDTAGRLHTKFNLMKELEKVRAVCARQVHDAPHETLLVLDATTGQNAISQAKHFKEAVQISGIILTKLDGTAKGGIVFAIQQELGVPVRFVGTGEKADDFAEFDPHAFVDGILG